MVKLNNEVIKILREFRKGKIETSLAELDKIEGFEVQKNLIKSQVGYFQEEHEIAMSHDEKALPFNDQWYAGNILMEHFFAYSNSAIEANRREEAAKFYNEYLENKVKQNLPIHKINFYKHQIEQHLRKIKGERNLLIDSKTYEIKNNGEPIEKYIEQYKNISGSSDMKSKDAIGYILHFLLDSGSTDECLRFYEDNWESAIIEDNHLKVAQIYKAIKQPEKSKQVILRFVKRFWLPVEHLQIVPMKLWKYNDLMEIMDRELKKAILESNKEKNRNGT